MASGSLNTFGGGISPGAFTISTTNNGGSGIALDQAGTIISPFGAAKFTIEHNVTGLSVSD